MEPTLSPLGPWRERDLQGQALGQEGCEERDGTLHFPSSQTPLLPLSFPIMASRTIKANPELTVEFELQRDIEGLCS